MGHYCGFGNAAAFCRQCKFGNMAGAKLGGVASALRCTPTLQLHLQESHDLQGIAATSLPLISWI